MSAWSLSRRSARPIDYLSQQSGPLLMSVLLLLSLLYVNGLTGREKCDACLTFMDEQQVLHNVPMRRDAHLAGPVE